MRLAVCAKGTQACPFLTRFFTQRTYIETLLHLRHFDLNFGTNIDILLCIHLLTPLTGDNNTNTFPQLFTSIVTPASVSLRPLILNYI